MSEVSQPADGTTASEPVTLIIRRRVKVGQEARYEDWLQRFQADARNLNGYLGVTTQRPAPSSGQPYVSVIRFDGPQSLRAFETSELRLQYLKEVAPYVDGDAVWESMSGLEFWFSPPPGTVVAQPSRHRMAMVMIAVVFLLVLSIGSLVGSALSGWPYAVRLLVTITIEVIFMTYWLMPRLTRWLAHWIYPKRRTI